MTPTTKLPDADRARYGRIAYEAMYRHLQPGEYVPWDALLTGRTQERCMDAAEAVIAAALDEQKEASYVEALTLFTQRTANYQALRERAERLRRHILGGRRDAPEPIIEALMGYGDKTSFQPGDLADDLIPPTPD